MVGGIQVHPIPAGLEVNVGPQPLRTLDTGEPAGGVQGADVGTTAEPFDGFFAECRLGRPVTSFPFTGSTPNVSHTMR
jgi:hypothetical protein